MPIYNPSSGSSAWALLSDTTLGVAGRFDIQNISQSYTHLMVELVGRSTVTATDDTVLMYFNNDTTSTNYRSILHYGQGATTSTASDADGARAGDVAAASAPADAPGIFRVWIPFYTETTFQKTAETDGGFRRDTTQMRASRWIMHWESTAAINRITVQPDGYNTDNFVAGSHMLIWGITG